MPPTSAVKEVNKSSPLFLISGAFFVLTGLAIFVFTFYPVLIAEIKYYLDRADKNSKITFENEKQSEENIITPINKDFSIIIPKIGANSKIIPNVDPYNEKEYQWQLTKGVVHAKDTAYPGQPGNVFIFSHSSQNFYEATRYNSIFYLLSKLEKGDTIYLVYKDEIFKYLVYDKKIVEAEEIKYLKKASSEKSLTLMTCWPPGTTLKRLLVLGEIATFSP